jgi:hypothetical protein
MRGTFLGFAAAAAALAIASAPASEAQGTENAPFANSAETEAYLTATVPEAVAANPKYRAKVTGALTRWTLKSIAFGKTPDDSVEVSTDESFEEYRGGKVTPGTHRARFPIDDVTVENEVSDFDTTESGAPALGVIFRCKGAPCIHANWNGDDSMSAWTDIYIDDAKTRERVLAAFQALKSPGQ